MCLQLCTSCAAIRLRLLTNLSSQVTLEIESEPPQPQISTAKADKEKERHNVSKKKETNTHKTDEVEEVNGDVHP